MDTEAKATPVRVRMRLAIGVGTAALVLAAAAYAAAPLAEISEHPRDVRRPQVVRVEWTATDALNAIVERRHGLRWETEADAGAGDVLVEGLGEDAWSARWQPAYYSPPGTYRIRVQGAGLALTSGEFRVEPCLCVLPSQLRARWHGGRFGLSVRGEYAPAPAGSFRELPRSVTTGRPLVRVLRDGRRVGSVRLRYRPGENGERGRFRGTWPGPRGPRDSVTFQLIALTDGFGNH
jgi:hypothetical protein